MSARDGACGGGGGGGGAGKQRAGTGNESRQGAGPDRGVVNTSPNSTNRGGVGGGDWSVGGERAV